MNTNKRWRQHLNELVTARLDPIVYALRWARDPRCLQNGVSHRRVGRVLNTPVCSLWAVQSTRGWE
ncbi:MAG TPA: hypothetical protein PKE27_08285 [Povalibacter sp.]|uniref:hypothetical protein n=1 Tax=Povalibacter sp. TaxID=1962978 RepID=UPI002BC94B8B|nr:hypothetical protein [Povalibacter sp.]HMN44555.1 hypothetical protein [Povalibacter sp.]